jgi:hypothetical protein
MIPKISMFYSRDRLRPCDWQWMLSGGASVLAFVGLASQLAVNITKFTASGPRLTGRISFPWWHFVCMSPINIGPLQCHVCGSSLGQEASQPVSRQDISQI